jgi:outer membrane protein OmpA-like peptidoglycan-associated protein
MMLRKALLAASVLALPVAAIAQPIDGLYVAGGVGTNVISSTKLKTDAGLTGSAHTPHGGVNGDLSVGYGYGNGFRAEAELVGVENNLKNKFNNGKRTGANGYLYGVLLNGLYDFNTGAGVTPYLGAGAGYVAQQIDSAGAKDGALGSFAVQGIAGVAFNVAPKLDLTVDYRAIDKLQNRNVGNNPGPGNVRVGAEITHTLNVGLRYALGAAAPVAAPAPAPVPAIAAPAPAAARTYLVFFDWDKADLTARAQQIIAEAAKASTKVKATRIDVAGHADKSGTAAYNQTLSLTRANNVAAELVRLGVPKSEIAITAFGDTKPLVPTAAGVREPQNRRVEIVLK